MVLRVSIAVKVSLSVKRKFSKSQLGGINIIYLGERRTSLLTRNLTRQWRTRAILGPKYSRGPVDRGPIVGSGSPCSLQDFASTDTLECSLYPSQRPRSISIQCIKNRAECYDSNSLSSELRSS